MVDEIEVIVVDNDSKDGTVYEIEKSFPAIKIIKNISNTGYAPACNQGIKMAVGEFVLLLGNDTIMSSDTLSRCIDFLKNNAECGAVGCRLTFPDGRLQGNCKKLPTVRNAFFTYLSLNKLNAEYDMLWFDYDSTIEVEQVATTFLMFRSSVLKNVGCFDEQYKILYNDVDLCKRVRESGYKIYFLHSAEIKHYGSHSTNKAMYSIRKIMYDDILRYFVNNFGVSAYCLYPLLKFRLFFVTLSKLLKT